MAPDETSPAISQFSDAIRLQLNRNQRNWDARTPIHVNSRFYGVGERDPMSWFAPFEWEDLGELAGRRVLHLQCHLGTETMAFALKGARATGLDFSGAAVQEAKRLARAAHLAIDYRHADVYAAVEALAGQRFDIVYTGKGALCYLPDLAGWARTVWELLRPGGFLYLVEFHPLLNALGPTKGRDEADDLLLRHDYLEGRGAIERDSSHTYTDGPPLSGDSVHYEWRHGLGEVVTALARCGFVIDSLTETELLPWPRWPAMVRTDSGWWALPPTQPRFPVMYGLKASRAR